MQSFCLIPLLFTLVYSSVIPNTLQPAEKRDTCASVDVKVVVDVLKIIKASPFCTSFLSIKTSTKTVTATTVGAPVVQTIITTIPVVISATATVSSTEIDVNTVTTTNGNPATVINTIESTVVTTVPTTIPITSTVTVDTYTNVGVAKRDTILEHNQPRDLKIPSQLISFGLGLITTACQCYVTTPTVTVTSIATSTLSSAVTTTALSTTTLYVATSTALTTTTSQTTVAVSNTVIVTLATTFPTTTTVATTSTLVQVVTATATISVSYTQVFSSGSGCVYNQYSQLTILEDAGYSTPNFEAARQDCATICDKISSCESFFIQYDPPSGRFSEEYVCYTNNVPYNSAEVQCGVSYAAQSEAYNKNS